MIFASFSKKDRYHHHRHHKDDDDDDDWSSIFHFFQMKNENYIIHLRKEKLNE